MSVEFLNVKNNQHKMAGTSASVAASAIAVLFLCGLNSASAQQQANLSASILQSAEPVANWWERGNENPVIHIIVNKVTQRVSVYADGMAISQSNVSTGKPGNDTPGGIFSILSKNKVHFSNLYDRAPMPFMQRLTWSGIALHGSSSVPDYPASHGCVRLPKKFARNLFSFTQKGAQVIVTGLDVRPERIYSTKMFEIGEVPAPENQAVQVTGNSEPKKSKSKTADEKPLRILITRHTGRQKFAEVQKLLNELQYSAGAVDGLMGPQTGRAITAFQKDYRHKVTGANSDQLLAQLYRASGKGKPKNAHLYVRRNYTPLFDMPVVLADEEVPLGTHHYMAVYPGRGNIDGQSVAKPHWLSVSIEQTGWPNMPESVREALASVKAARSKFKVIKASVLPSSPSSPSAPGENAVEEIAPTASTASNAQQALERITLPQTIRDKISKLITPGSTLVIADEGTSLETGLGTDFIVLTK